MKEPPGNRLGVESSAMPEALRGVVPCPRLWCPASRGGQPRRTGVACRCCPGGISRSTRARLYLTHNGPVWRALPAFEDYCLSRADTPCPAGTSSWRQQAGEDERRRRSSPKPMRARTHWQPFSTPSAQGAYDGSLRRSGVDAAPKLRRRSASHPHPAEPTALSCRDREFSPGLAGCHRVASSPERRTSGRPAPCSAARIWP